MASCTRFSPGDGSDILPSQAVDIACGFLLDPASFSSITITDTVFQRELQGYVDVEYFTSGTRSLLALKPTPSRPWPWGNEIQVDLSGVKKSDGTSAFGARTLTYLISDRPALSAYVSAAQLALLVARSGTGIWATGLSEQTTRIFQDPVFNTPAMAYPTRPEDWDAVDSFYNGTYNAGRGATDDGHFMIAHAVHWKATGQQVHLTACRDVLLEWVYNFPVGSPDSNSRWDYSIKYDLVTTKMLFAYELIRDQLTSVEVRDTNLFFRRWADPIKFAHDRLTDTSPNNIRTWDNAAFMAIASVCNDWTWRDYVFDPNFGGNGFWVQDMWDRAVDNVGGVPRMHDRNRADPVLGPHLGITYSTYHLEAWTWIAHHRFMMDGMTDVWDLPSATQGWTLEDVITEYERAVRCDVGSGFESTEGYCVNWAGDGDPVNDRLRRRLWDSWKLSPLESLAHPRASIYDLILPANRGGFADYETADLHIASFGSPWKGYPASGWPLGGPSSPPAPLNLELIDRGRGWIHVRWNQPTPSDEYGAPVRWILTANGIEKGRAISPEFSISQGIAPGTTYTLNVTAINEAGEQQASAAPIVVTTRAV